MKIVRYIILISALLTIYGLEAREITNKAKDGPKGRFVITGYGDLMYTQFTNKKNNDSFSAGFSPIFLFKLSDKLHAEAELEIGINSETKKGVLSLEYADIHYYATDTTIITAGKFLLPFAQFGPNIHPSWINRLPTMPALYSTHHGDAPVTGIIPIFSDFGISIQQIIPISHSMKIYIDAYIVNGPRPEVEEAGEEAHEHGAGEEEGDWVVEPREQIWSSEIAFEASPKDNNRKKATGGRIAFAFLPAFEIGASVYQGAWNDREDRDWLELEVQGYTNYTPRDRNFTAKGVDVAIIGTHWRLRGEYMRTNTEVFQPYPRYSGNPIPSQRARGWYAEASLQLGIFGFTSLASFEIVARYASIMRYGFERLEEFYGISSGEIGFSPRDRLEEQATYGVNYWLNETGVIKVAYEDNKLPYKHDQKLSGIDFDRILVQFAYGF